MVVLKVKLANATAAALSAVRMPARPVGLAKATPVPNLDPEPGINQFRPWSPRKTLPRKMGEFFAFWHADI
jgi:hypothetical protein